MCIFAIHNVSVTDQQCSWKRPGQSKDVWTVKELYPPPKKYKALSREVTSQEKADFQQGLSELRRFTALGWIMSPEPIQSPPTEPPIPTMQKIIKEKKQDVSSVLSALAITEEQRDAVNTYTLSQRADPAWFELRRGRLTASNFGYVLATKQDRPSKSVLERVLGQKCLDGVKAIQWGIINEKEGIRILEQALLVKVEPSGLWLTSSGILGATPDGLVGASAVVEVKCPYKFRNATIEEAMASKGFYLHKEGQEIKLKDNHPYWHQVVTN